MSSVYPDPGRRAVLEYMPDETAHRRDIARAVNQLMAGHNNATLDVTLDPGSAFTDVIDARVSMLTACVMVPKTAHAAAEIAAGTLWCVPSKGVVRVNHSNSVVADRVFKVVLIG